MMRARTKKANAHSPIQTLRSRRRACSCSLRVGGGGGGCLRARPRLPGEREGLRCRPATGELFVGTWSDAAEDNGVRCFIAIGTSSTFATLTFGSFPPFLQLRHVSYTSLSARCCNLNVLNRVLCSSSPPSRLHLGCVGARRAAPEPEMGPVRTLSGLSHNSRPNVQRHVNRRPCVLHVNTACKPTAAELRRLSPPSRHLSQRWLATAIPFQQAGYRHPFNTPRPTSLQTVQHKLSHEDGDFACRSPRRRRCGGSG